MKIRLGLLSVLAAAGCVFEASTAQATDTVAEARTEAARYEAQGMACKACATRLEVGIRKLEGIIKADVDFDAKVLSVQFDASKIDLARIKSEIERLGFEARLAARRDWNTRVMIIVRSRLAGAVLVMITGCRSGEPSSAEPPPRASSALPAVQAPMASNQTSSLRELVLDVEGLTCEGCAWQIRDTLQKVDGIGEVSATVADKRVVVTYDPHQVTSEAVRQTLDKVGYKSVEVP